MRNVLKILGALQLAMALMAVLIVVLIGGTFVEKWYGDAAARFGVYGTWWFTGLGGLLALNIFSALAARFPWKKGQAGFVVAHVGLLILLLGCLVSREAGREATLAMSEGDSSSIAYKDAAQHLELDGQQHFELTIFPEEKGPVAGPHNAAHGQESSAAKVSIPFTPGPFNWDDYHRLPAVPWALAHRDEGLIYDRGGIRLEALDYLGNAQLLNVPQIQVETAAMPAQPPDRAEEDRGPFLLQIQPAAGPHGAGRPYGFGTRHPLAGGQQLVFWMSGSPAETAAFRASPPRGPLGKLGRLVLFARGETFDWGLDDWKPGTRRPLGKTGLEVELLRQDSTLGSLHLKVYGGGSPQPMVVSAEFPEMVSQQDYRDEVFGSYWIEAQKPPADAVHGMNGAGKMPVDAAHGMSGGSKMPADAIHGMGNASNMPKDAVHGMGSATKMPADAIHRGTALREADRPRIELFQGADQKLYLRTVRKGQVEVSGPIDVDEGKIAAFEGTPDAVTLLVGGFIPAAKPDVVAVGLPLERGKDQRHERQVRLRLTVDGASEEFWLAGLSRDPLDRFTPPADAQRLLAGNGRRVRVALVPDVLPLGFDIRLRKAERKLDPGTKQPSYYASHLDFLPTGQLSQTAETGEKPDHGAVHSAGNGGKPLWENVPVVLNSPVDFADPASGRSYRLFQTAMQGPFPPADVQSDAREPVYVSYLTVNYDPGRGLVYAGCLLVVVGIFVRYYGKDAKLP
jgi:hypothetical protein